MYAFKIIVTTLDVIMISLMLWFCCGGKSRENIIGFGSMILLYLANVACMWR